MDKFYIKNFDKKNHLLKQDKEENQIYLFSPRTLTWEPIQIDISDASPISDEEAELIIKAAIIATEAHKGAEDKSGVPYIEHPITVFETTECKVPEMVVALLHDVVEDTTITIADLANKGFPPDIVASISAISRMEFEPRDIYLMRVASDKVAKNVKLADLRHNSDISRIKNPTEKDFVRVEKYKQVIETLEKSTNEIFLKW